MRKRGLWIGLVLLAAIMLGAAREFLFINLNYAIDHLENHRAVSYAHSAFRAAVRGLSLKELVVLKWVFALVFTGSMLLLSITMARVLFGDHRYIRALVTGFLGIGTIALLLHLGARFLPLLEGISVKLLHLLQYPVILLFLWAASMLVRKEGKTAAHGPGR